MNRVAPSAAELVDRAAAEGAPLALRWACLVLGSGASAEQARSAAERLRAPADCRDAGRLLVELAPQLARARTLGAEGWLALIERADALRRPERLPGLVAACGWAGADAADVDEARRQLGPLTEAAREAGKVAAEEATRARMAPGPAVRAARLQAIAAALAAPAAGGCSP